MSVDEIKNLDTLINLPPNEKILNQKVRRFTAPGENYGSLMLGVDITIQTSNGTKVLQTVAKMVPPNEFIQEIFNTQVTFRNEIAFYKDIVPTLQNFQKSHGIEEVLDISAQYYGSRLNLKNDDSKVDSDAALILKNLKSEGFVTLDRINGLGLDEVKLVLINLAKLHGTTLALKQQKPDIFKSQILPYITDTLLFEEQREKIKSDIKKITDIDALKPIQEQIVAAFEECFKEHTPNEDFATLTQNDCWTNNNLFKYENGKAVKTVLVDYQVCLYDSPGRDVLFFIYSSATNEVIKNHYDELLKLYFDHFICNMKQLKCDLQKYTFDAFLKELDWAAKTHVAGQLSFMIFPIYAANKNTKEIEELSPDTLSLKEATKEQTEKFVFVFTEFAKKGWI